MNAPEPFDLVALIADALAKRRAALEASGLAEGKDFVLEVTYHPATRSIDMRIRPPSERLETDAA